MASLRALELSFSLAALHLQVPAGNQYHEIVEGAVPRQRRYEGWDHGVRGTVVVVQTQTHCQYQGFQGLDLGIVDPEPSLVLSVQTGLRESLV